MSSNVRDIKMATDIEDEKQLEETVDRCESCLQFLDAESPLPAIKIAPFDKDNDSISVDEKTAIFDPKVDINNNKVEQKVVTHLHVSISLLSLSPRERFKKQPLK